MGGHQVDVGRCGTSSEVQFVIIIVKAGTLSGTGVQQQNSLLSLFRFQEAA